MTKDCFLKLTLLALVVGIHDVPYSFAEDTVTNIKNKIEQIKDNAAQGDDAFAVEQEEFEKMRAQLLEAEQQALAKAATETRPEALPETVTTETQKANHNETESNIVAGDGLDAAREAIANTDENYEILKEEHEKTLQQLAQTKAEAKKATAESANTASSINELKTRLSKMERELQETKNKLLVSETEIDRLTGIIKNQGRERAQLSTKSRIPADLDATAKMKKVETTSTENDDLTLTVVAEQSVLRAGPNQNETKLVEVDRGTRLRVDDRQGDWFRVTNRSGTRAWISAADVAFGPTGASSPSATVRIKPSSSTESDAAIEERALELIKSGAKK